MTEKALIQEVNAELTVGCALPYALPEKEIQRIIKRAVAWFYDNYQYAVEDRFLALPKEIFEHPDFRKNRIVQLPDCIVTVYEMKEVSGIGILGQPDRDFADSKLLGAEIFLSPFQGDNLVYRTAMYSLFDLAKAYNLEHVAYSFNKNTKRISVLGRNPFKDCFIRVCTKIPEETLYDDETFVRYVLAKAKIELGRILGAFNYNLPGGVSVNFADIKSDGKDELAEILEKIDADNSPDWFFMFHVMFPFILSSMIFNYL